MSLIRQTDEDYFGLFFYPWSCGIVCNYVEKLEGSVSIFSIYQLIKVYMYINE